MLLAYTMRHVRCKFGKGLNSEHQNNAQYRLYTRTHIRSSTSINSNMPLHLKRMTRFSVFRNLVLQTVIIYKVQKTQKLI